MKIRFCSDVGGLDAWRKGSLSGFGEASEYIYLPSIWRELYSKVPQLVLCAIPVFFKIPGVGGTDLGGRTEGALSNYSTFLNTNEQFPVFVTNRRLLLSSSGRDTSAIQP